MIHQRLSSPSLSLSRHLCPHRRKPICSNAWETGGVMAYERRKKKKKKIQHPTLSLLLASMSQWIFYELSPEVHKHWEREREEARKIEWAKETDMRGGAERVPFQIPHKMLPCIERAWTPAVGELTGRWQHFLFSSCKQGCVTPVFCSV